MSIANNLPSRIDFARNIALEAGEFTLKYFNNPDLIVERKNDESPVTVADRGAEELLRKRIEEFFPEDSILGEEFPDKMGTNDYRWLLDPIDGTKSFIHGVPLYSTLIGLEKAGETIIGVIAIPALGEVIWAENSSGAWYTTAQSPEPRPAKVSNCQNLADALFVTSEVITFDRFEREKAYKELESKTRLTRTWGDAYGYFMVATGRADIMVDPALSPWDAGPLLVILREAGGKFTDWNGEATIFGDDGIGTNGHLHNDVLSIVRPFGRQKKTVQA